MVLFVFVLDVVEDVKGLFGRGGLEDDFLETTFQRTILFDVLAVFVQRGGADTLQFATGQCGFEEVGGIHAAGRVTSAYHRVQLVDEEDDIGVFLQFFEDGFHALLELSAVFGACHKSSHVKADNALMHERARHVTRRNLQRKSLSQSGFADTRLANQHRIVLFAAT